MKSTIKHQLESWIDTAASGGIGAYVVLDGAWQENLIKQVRSRPDGWEPLLGEVGENRSMSHVRSPLIADLGLRGNILAPWIEDGFKNKLGMVIFSKMDLGALRTSLKRFVRVITPETPRASYFRFYDARTLRCFLVNGFPAQWLDFMSGIDVIAAPSDYSAGWSLFKMEQNALLEGRVPDGTTEIVWRTVASSEEDHAYEASFPFRRINQSQFDKLNQCCNEAFSIEIAEFLLRAFPVETSDMRSDELLNWGSKARQTGSGKGYFSEDCQFYFVVLAFMGGLDFYLKPETEAYLRLDYMDPATKLENLLQQVSRSLENPALEELVDKTEITVTYASGRQMRYRSFSGKVLFDR